MQSRPADDKLPADWTPIWDTLLRWRAGAALQRPPAPIGDLGWHAGAGWHWQRDASAAALALFALYKPLLDAATGTEQPWWLAQLGQSLDGCIATATGDSCFVTGEASLLHLHRLRALCDAVLVGAGTAAADNPQLTTRRVPGPHATRVFLDPDARLDGRVRALHDGVAPSLWLCDARHRLRAEACLGAGSPAQVLAVEGLLDIGGSLVPARAVQALARHGLRRVFVEGGGVTVSRFLDAGCLDRLHLVVAPLLIGQGRRGLQLPPRAALADCLRPPATVHVLGEDRLWDLDLRGARDAVSATAPR